MGWITVGKMVTHTGGEPHSFWFRFESATFKGPITACANVSTAISNNFGTFRTSDVTVDVEPNHAAGALPISVTYRFDVTSPGGGYYDIAVGSFND